MTKKVVLLASGGLDSTTVAFGLREEEADVSPLFFDYGQHCAETEWNRVNEVLPLDMKRPERVDLSDLFRGSKSRLIVEADLWKDDVPRIAVEFLVRESHGRRSNRSRPRRAPSRIAPRPRRTPPESRRPGQAAQCDRRAGSGTDRCRD